MRAYVGRFAPSPTGPLHIGSLLAAAASFLHARQHRGKWLLRIENIDPPREPPGTTDAILSTLDTLELHWDGAPAYQVDRVAHFRRAADQLLETGSAFRCVCSRRQIRAISGDNRYPGTCRQLQITATPSRIRVIAPIETSHFVDRLQGPVSYDIQQSEGDYLIYRLDGLPAYHLAVVIDDACSGVTDVVRGIDLLEQTAIHAHLQALLGYEAPSYWHLPVVVDGNGIKLSKQTGARAVDVTDPSASVWMLLRLLGARPPSELRGAPPRELWGWAIDHWSIDALKGCSALPAPA